MTKSIHEPIEQSHSFSEEEKEEHRKKARNFIILFVGAIAAFVISFIFSEHKFVYMGFSLIVIFFTGFFAISHRTLAKQDAYKQYFKIDEKGIFKTSINFTKGTEESEQIYFENIKRVIVSNYANPYYSEISNKKRYALGSLIVIEHTEGEYFLYVYKLEQFKDFLNRFLDKNCPLFRSEKNIEPLVIEHLDQEFDYSQLPIEPWDGMSNYPTFEEDWDFDPYEKARL